MPRFSQRSKKELNTCDIRLRNLFNHVIKTYDCTILEGHRGEEKQERMVKEGKSKLHWPESKHNSSPCMALDVGPYPINWEKTYTWYHFAGYVLRTAHEMDIRIRWGGDWDRDLQFDDQTFKDLPHVELV